MHKHSQYDRHKYCTLDFCNIKISNRKTQQHGFVLHIVEHYGENAKFY